MLASFSESLTPDERKHEMNWLWNHNHNPDLGALFVGAMLLFFFLTDRHAKRARLAWWRSLSERLLRKPDNWCPGGSYDEAASMSRECFMLSHDRCASICSCLHHLRLEHEAKKAYEELMEKNRHNPCWICNRPHCGAPCAQCNERKTTS